MQMVTVLVSNIKYGIEGDDVIDQCENYDELSEDERLEWIDSAIDDQQASLPDTYTVRLDADEYDDEDAMFDAAVDYVSEETGWLIESCETEIMKGTEA